MWKKDGPLAQIGLVASPDEVMAANEKAVTELTTISAEDLK